jgi:hypothetical protein
MAISTSDHRSHARVALRLTLEGEREIDALSEGERAELAVAWHGRARDELYSREAFRRVIDAFNELSAGPALTAVAMSAREDELRHAELCRAMADRFAGHELPLPAATSATFPEFPGASSRLAASLRVIAHSVIAEIFATSVLECSLRQASGRLARSVLVQILSDELDHAPIGWTYLAGTSESERRSIEPYLHALVAIELKRARSVFAHERGLPVHGVPAHDHVERALFASLRASILPGFLSFGMPAPEIWTWLRTGASTRGEALDAVANLGAQEGSTAAVAR